MDSYLFILTSNQSGSTLLQNLFAECENVVHLEKKEQWGSYSITEGHHHVQKYLPNLAKQGQGLVWTERIDEISNPDCYDWEKVKAGWYEIWRKQANYHQDNKILMQRSPHDVGRMKLIEENFPNAWFVIQVRNPYAVAEGVRRRMTSSMCDIRRAGHHAIKVLELQKNNIMHGNRVLAWRYEDLLAKQYVLEDMINHSIPYIQDFSFSREAPADSVDGYVKRRVTNLNDKQINSLKKQDIKILNSIFDKHSNVMNFFNYERLNHEVGN